MAPVNPATVKAAISIGKAIFGFFGSRKAKKKAKAAAAEAALQKQKVQDFQDQYAMLDTSNPYMNMENMYEDMTINQQEAEFMRRQQGQSRANILDRLRQSAGASGVAALAQQLANQGSIDAQKAAASIGKQEASIQEKSLKEAGRIQDLERSGDIMSRQAEFDILESQMGLSADQQAVSAENARLFGQQRQGQLGNMFSAANDMAGNTGGMGNLFSGIKNFDSSGGLFSGIKNLFTS
tara:strand:+ start:505 stop:1218 length:714 start_codon:yes stop_codon:yes gene_type:complete